jgi:hypothetical protein
MRVPLGRSMEANDITLGPIIAYLVDEGTAVADGE